MIFQTFHLDVQLKMCGEGIDKQSYKALCLMLNLSFQSHWALILHSGEVILLVSAQNVHVLPTRIAKGNPIFNLG